MLDAVNTANKGSHPLHQWRDMAHSSTNRNLMAFGSRRTGSTIVLGPMAENGLTFF
jgi:hypothetical protein